MHENTVKLLKVDQIILLKIIRDNESIAIKQIKLILNKKIEDLNQIFELQQTQNKIYDNITLLSNIGLIKYHITKTVPPSKVLKILEKGINYISNFKKLIQSFNFFEENKPKMQIQIHDHLDLSPTLDENNEIELTESYKNILSEEFYDDMNLITEKEMIKINKIAEKLIRKIKIL